MLLIDCGVLLEELLADMAGSIRESNTLIESEELPTIYPYHELNYLFLNLISNAIKFRKPNQQLLITIKAVESSYGWIFSVKENGIGIDLQYHEKIFTIFQKLHSKTAYSGSGIGLAHCKKIVELHGGKIWMESELMKGSTFYFSIPKNIPET